jgi:GTP cyclohydrolase III
MAAMKFLDSERLIEVDELISVHSSKNVTPLNAQYNCRKVKSTQKLGQKEENMTLHIERVYADDNLNNMNHVDSKRSTAVLNLLSRNIPSICIGGLLSLS